MNEKIIIRNDTDINTAEIVGRVEEIMNEGRASSSGGNSQYLYAVRFGDDVVITCTKNKGESFTFNAYTASTNVKPE